MPNSLVSGPEATAVMVSLWRALHVELDPPPHVFEDRLGLALIAPPPGWRGRSGMDPVATRRVRASMVGRSRFVEDVVEEEFGRGVDQYLVLGAGLDTFAQRRADIASKTRIFEVDRPGPQAWKREQLLRTGIGIPDWLHLVPADLETGTNWFDAVVAAGFDTRRPAVVSALGLSMYLTRAAITALLRWIAEAAPGSTLVMSFLLPADTDGPEERVLRIAAERRISKANAAFLSSFRPEQLLELARASGFVEARHISSDEMSDLYFKDREDGLLPLGSEELMVART